MIRVFTIFCKLKFKDLFLAAIKEFSTEKLPSLKMKCPFCGAKCPEWSYYDSYGRYLISYEMGTTVTYDIDISRIISSGGVYTMKRQFNNESAIEMAYFRFALIAPVIQGIFPDPTKTAYYRRVTQNDLTLPNGKIMRYNPKTLEKWEEYYRKMGMDGLMPRQRSDSGTTRVLNESAISEIHRLKEQFPRINATLIYSKLIEDGFINQHDVSVSSVQRFIKHNNLKSAFNPNQKDRKA